jgi:hypothetical protein
VFEHKRKRLRVNYNENKIEKHERKESVDKIEEISKDDHSLEIEEAALAERRA